MTIQVSEMLNEIGPSRLSIIRPAFPLLHFYRPSLSTPAFSVNLVTTEIVMTAMDPRTTVARIPAQILIPDTQRVQFLPRDAAMLARSWES